MIENTYTLYTPLGGMFVSPNPGDISRIINTEAGRDQLKSPLVYLAGPMSGHPEFNHPAFHAAAAKLREQGYSVINPAEINPDTTKTWEQCLRRDIQALADCHILALLPGWEPSKGARIEYDIAQALGMTIIFLDAYPQFLTNQPAVAA